MNKLILILIFSLFFSQGYGQKKENGEIVKIKGTIINFLKWYRLDQIVDTAKQVDSGIKYHPIIVWKQIDTLIKVNIDMKAVESYLVHLRSSNCLSESFINDLRQYHQKIADEIELVKPFPAREGEFAIPGLNLDPIFGFEPEDILDHIKKGRFTKINIIYDKAIVKFDITNINQYIFTLTKVDNRWLIDYYGLDRTNIDRIIK
ncbi:hypothetical protein ACFOG5_16820 [Pedobacter fastidiosus]|uniref:DUF3828 domain-containing protein n=1 Tax=Pedobacter fastidiosus TaxID=2765361 RepID=A0ABR7KRN0_9SPHI|nr:hypothetical protein [Pedobacter fastidiosus]MBC6110744.1 hypothetical protein [Pedobacter fastidiosus]